MRVTAVPVTGRSPRVRAHSEGALVLVTVAFVSGSRLFAGFSRSALASRGTARSPPLLDSIRGAGRSTLPLGDDSAAAGRDGAGWLLPLDDELGVASLGTACSPPLDEPGRWR